MRGRLAMSNGTQLPHTQALLPAVGSSSRHAASGWDRNKEAAQALARAAHR
jgi:hypothetical protein